VTEGETATETELETEIEDEISISAKKLRTFSGKVKAPVIARHQTNLSVDSSMSSNGDLEHSIMNVTSPRNVNQNLLQRRKVLSQHDLLNKYFRRDVVVLRNVDLLRLVSALC